MPPAGGSSATRSYINVMLIQVHSNETVNLLYLALLLQFKQKTELEVNVLRPPSWVGVEGGGGGINLSGAYSHNPFWKAFCLKKSIQEVTKVANLSSHVKMAKKLGRVVQSVACLTQRVPEFDCYFIYRRSTLKGHIASKI